jgi:hypothetical protein
MKEACTCSLGKESQWRNACSGDMALAWEALGSNPSIQNKEINKNEGTGTCLVTLLFHDGTRRKKKNKTNTQTPATLNACSHLVLVAGVSVKGSPGSLFLLCNLLTQWARFTGNLSFLVNYSSGLSFATSDKTIRLEVNGVCQGPGSPHPLPSWAHTVKSNSVFPSIVCCPRGRAPRVLSSATESMVPSAEPSPSVGLEVTRFSSLRSCFQNIYAKCA